MLFASFFIAESLFVYTRQSATMDEPIHVADGYFSLHGDYRFDPEHPPLLRMYAALPLLFSDVVSDTRVIDSTGSDTWALGALANEAHRFLYVQNDADRLLYRARFMIVLLGVLLGVLVYAWILEWIGFVPAVVALAMIAFEPNIGAHFSIVSTDAGLAVFAVGALYFLWRVCRTCSPLNIAGLCLFCALSIASKYSAVLLYPIVIGLLVLSVYPFRRITSARAATVVALLLTSSYVGLWASYGFHYSPSANAEWQYSLHSNPYLAERVPSLAAVTGAVDAAHLLPNVFSEGFFIGQAKAQQRRAFLMGSFSETGWWYFFPVAVLIKTPMSLLLLSVVGFVSLLRVSSTTSNLEPRTSSLDPRPSALDPRPSTPEMVAFLMIPILGFLLPPMVSHLNIGLRHVLPIYPFLIMLAAFAVARLIDTPRRSGRIVAGAAALVWLVEFGRAYPHPLAFFNTLVGGPAQGARYLVDSNLDWGQDLKGLKVWMDERGVQEINLAYFGAADPVYYGIRARYIHGGLPYVRNDQVTAPVLPGYVAVSATLESGALVPEAARDTYWGLRSLTPVAVIGHSIKIYWVERPWWN